MKYDVVIIGAGAAGLFCAIESAKRGRKTVVIEHGKKPAEKIRISGGGRCNFTNLHAKPENYISQNPKFCISALKNYTQHDFINLVKKHNIPFHEKTLGQLFCDNSAQDIINMLLQECKQAGVEIRLNTKITEIQKDEGLFSFYTASKQNLQSQSLVIACGGKSIPKLGSTSFGYEVAEKFGINIIPTRAALVPLTFQNDILTNIKQLAGVSLPVRASFGKTSFDEAMLFTHRGLSGPAILQISSYWQEGKTLTLNLLPQEDMYQFLLNQREVNPKQNIKTTIAGLLPNRVADFMLHNHNQKLAELSNKKLQQIADEINRWQILPNGTEGYRTAEVTLGGVDTSELSSKTFESKKVQGLYFIGEVVDVTGNLGGFNFQWAWSSGHAAGQWV